MLKMNPFKFVIIYVTSHKKSQCGGAATTTTTVLMSIEPIEVIEICHTVNLEKSFCMKSVD